jgi:hypothetical protein
MTAAAMFVLPEVTAGSLSPHGGAQSLARAPRRLKVPLADDDDPVGHQNVVFVLCDTNTAIEEARAGGHVVLVHCGMHRDPTIGTLYAMRRAGASLGEAIAAMERVLPGADPPGAFRAALERARTGGGDTCRPTGSTRKAEHASCSASTPETACARSSAPSATGTGSGGRRPGRTPCFSNALGRSPLRDGRARRWLGCPHAADSGHPAGQ